MSTNRGKKYNWRFSTLCSLLLAAALLTPAAASAAGERGHSKDVPHNARYKNPTRNARDKNLVQNARYKNPPRHDHRRYDDRYAGRYHDGGKYRHPNYKRHYRHYDKHPHRARVYHHYEYVPYYAPVAVAYPYYCDLCHAGFYAEPVFYEHVGHAHGVARGLISGLLTFNAGTFFFGIGF